jgi:hypothetical protein
MIQRLFCGSNFITENACENISRNKNKQRLKKDIAEFSPCCNVWSEINSSNLLFFFFHNRVEHENNSS